MDYRFLNKRCTIYLAFLLFSVQPSFSFDGKYPIHNFLPDEYKAGNQNIDFAQNRDMSLFVANNLGVLSFNGNEWNKHAFRSGKKKRSLAFDEKTNQLYVGSQGDFGFFKNNWSYVSLIDKIPSDSREFDEVWNVFIIDSKVYFCTFQGIYVYDGQSISVIKYKEDLNRSFCVNGVLFTQTQRGRLLELKDGELAPSFKQNQTDKIIAGIIPQKEGHLVFYNSGQIELSTPFGVSEKYETLIKALQGTYVNHVLQLSDKRLAISTQTSGLFLYDVRRNAIEKITTRDGLQTNACLRTFQDHVGNLWVGMQNGIALVYINSPFRMINKEINIEGSGYEAFQTNGGVYYTTSNGIYFLANNSEKSIFLKGTEGPSYGMQRIAGKLYAGHHTGLFILEKDSAVKVGNTNGLWQIKQLKSNPEFAVAGTYSGLFLFKVNENKVLEAVQEIRGFNESSRFFEEDQYGGILVGQYYKGLYQLQFEKNFTQVIASKVIREKGLPLDEQIILTRLDNDLFLATKQGLYKIDPTNNQIVNAGLFSEVIGEQPVHLVAQDKQENIHIVAENLVGFFKKISAKNYVFVPSSLYELRYYFNNDLLNASVNVNKGIMLSSNEGFIHYNPELEDHFANKQPLVVRRVYSVSQDSIFYWREPFDVNPKIEEGLVINQRAKVLQFEVETFQFDEVKNKQYRYVLKGFEENYGEWTTSATKEYTNLDEGEYEFIAQTRNHLGEIVTCKSFKLIVKPLFFNSVYAKALYVALGILLLFLASRNQKLQYKRKTKAVEDEKRIELARKEEEVFEIERQKELELKQLEEVRMMNELQHTNSLLGASTMNLVVKNEFIETIKDQLKEVKRKGKNRETKQALEEIVKKIDKTLRLQEDWHQFEYHFDQVHGDFLNRLRNEFLELTPNEQKLCTLLRLNLNTKEIANLMNISIRGVEVARYRLRQKLGLAKGKNLSKFILEY